MEPVVDDHPQVEQLVQVAVIGDDGLMDFFDAPAVELVALQRFEYKEVAGGRLDPVHIGTVTDGGNGPRVFEKPFYDAHVDVEGGAGAEINYLALAALVEEFAQVFQRIFLFVGEEDAALLAMKGQVEDREFLAHRPLFPFVEKKFKLFPGGAVVVHIVAIPAVVHQVEDGQHGRFVLHIVVVPQSFETIDSFLFHGCIRDGEAKIKQEIRALRPI